MKLLTVDDSAVMRKLISDCGAAAGYEMLEAADGVAALATLEEHADEIALVLLDWNMPGMSGFEALEAIRAGKKTKDIPVMMVTTESERMNVIRAVKAGANNYLAKPFASEDLVTKILQTVREAP